MAQGTRKLGAEPGYLTWFVWWAVILQREISRVWAGSIKPGLETRGKENGSSEARTSRVEGNGAWTRGEGLLQHKPEGRERWLGMGPGI